MNTPDLARPLPSPLRRSALFFAAAFAIVAVAAYHRTLSAPFVLDDAGSILENASIRQLWSAWVPPTGGTTVAGRPLLNFSFAVNYAISGDGVWSYHALNLAIHWLAACTLFGLVRRTLLTPRLRDRFGTASTSLAAAIAAIWLLHPLATAAVTYVSQRGESLASLCGLLTLYGFVRAAEAQNQTRALAWQVLSWLACLLGMVTKEIAVVFPLLAVVYSATLLDADLKLAEVWRRRRGYLLALVSTWLLLLALVLQNPARGGTAGFDTGLSPIVYLQTQARAVVGYLGLAVWPHPLIFDRGLAVVTRLTDVWPQALMLLGLIAATAVALLRRSPAAFLGGAFFALLAPSSSILPIASETAAEHRVYLPLAAIVALIATAAYAALGRRSLWLWPAVAGLLGVLTFLRNETYRSELALWSDTVAKLPGNGRARYNLAIVLSQQGRHAEAVAQSAAALRFDDSWAAVAQAPATHNKLGGDLAALGRDAEAVAHFEAALRGRPGYGLAHLNLARALVRLGRIDEAPPHFAAALQQEIGGPTVVAELGEALLRIGRFASAIDVLREAVRLNPRDAGAWVGLGYALATTDRHPEAIEALEAALRADANYAPAHRGLAFELRQVGRPEEAAGHLRIADQLDAATTTKAP